MISGFWMYSLWCWSLDSSSQMGTSQHFPLWCLSSLCSITFTMSNYLSALIGNNLLSNQHRLSFNNCRSLWICCSGFGKQKSTSLGIFILLCDLSTERFVQFTILLLAVFIAESITGLLSYVYQDKLDLELKVDLQDLFPNRQILIIL